MSDERADLRRDGRTARPGPAALPGPEELEGGPLSPDHRLGLDDGDRLRPVVPHAGEQGPEEPVGSPETWARCGALEDGQLIAQREVLEHQGAVASDPAEEAGEDQGEHGGHHRSGRPTVQC
jgi:hypothetical protein